MLKTVIRLFSCDRCSTEVAVTTTDPSNGWGSLALLAIPPTWHNIDAGSLRLICDRCWDDYQKWEKKPDGYQEAPVVVVKQEIMVTETLVPTSTSLTPFGP